MNRRKRLLLAIVAFPMLATFAPPSLFSEPVPPARPSLAFTEVPLEEGNAARRSVGKLLYLGGWSIRSNDARFGGISAMDIEGGAVTALSDSGWLIRFALPAGRRSSVSIEPLSTAGGVARSKTSSDVEAMAVHRRRAWLAIEGRNEIWRYDRKTWISDAAAAPKAMEHWPGNAGSEAMVRLPDGRFLLFCECKARPDGSSEAVLFSGDPTRPGTTSETLHYKPPEGYRITEAALLPDGRLLFLNRRVALADGVSAKLTVADSSKLGPGSVLRGQEIAHLGAPLTVDNMEALSIAVESGRTIVWIASDDNYIPLQRTLLLKFALIE